MIRKLLAAATFALALSPVALAQDAPKFSTKTSTIGQILDNPEAKAAFAKTSGKRDIHVYARVAPKWTFTDVRHAAIAFARELERRTHGVTTKWWKEERGDNIFVDFNQNCRDRTIASAYSLRPTPGATVSMPVSWEELAGLTDPRAFTLHTVPAKLAADGDAWAAIDDIEHSLDALLRWWDADPSEMPYPPEYPKMPGEPKRVQPSKDTRNKKP